MDAGTKTVSIGVLTFRRPEGLRRCLSSIQQRAELGPGWSYGEILVVDNDPHGSAATSPPTTEMVAGPWAVRFVHEPRPGVSAARNRALDETTSHVLVFVDDDEEILGGWPKGLLDEMSRSGAAMVGGPVRTSFEAEPPAWVSAGNFFQRAEPPTGTPHEWLRTGNLAIDMDQIRSSGVRFDEAFGRSGSEDCAFSDDLRAKGASLSWSADAIVTEWVPEERVSVKWLARRERQATSGFVRAQLRSRSTVRVGGRALLTVAARTLEGTIRTLYGLVSGQKHLSARGIILLARSWGTIDGLWGRSAVSYGDAGTSGEVGSISTAIPPNPAPKKAPTQP